MPLGRVAGVEEHEHAGRADALAGQQAEMREFQPSRHVQFRRIAPLAAGQVRLPLPRPPHGHEGGPAAGVDAEEGEVAVARPPPAAAHRHRRPGAQVHRAGRVIRRVGRRPVGAVQNKRRPRRSRPPDRQDQVHRLPILDDPRRRGAGVLQPQQPLRRREIGEPLEFPRQAQAGVRVGPRGSRPKASLTGTRLLGLLLPGGQQLRRRHAVQREAERDRAATDVIEQRLIPPRIGPGPRRISRRPIRRAARQKCSHRRPPPQDPCGVHPKSPGDSDRPFGTTRGASSAAKRTIRVLPSPSFDVPPYLFPFPSEPASSMFDVLLLRSPPHFTIQSSGFNIQYSPFPSFALRSPLSFSLPPIAYYPLPSYFPAAGAGSSWITMSLYQTSVGGPPWIWRAMMPLVGIFSSASV